MSPNRGDQPRILPRAEHPISRRQISKNAIKVLYRLHNAGYRACLVGGSVRDLMLGRQPKDFDAGTDAKPAQIKRLFRNSRIIGRRFRLVHVFFHDSTVEVSTFRREPEPEAQDGEPGDLLITSDNTFGTPEEDAFRRDFTVNALFYDIADYSVVDYVGGIEDLERRLIRAIGDPNVRFQEDPVRMLRACEFAARLAFGIEDQTQEAILAQRESLAKASPARLTEELIQLLRCGHAGAAIQWMLELGLADILVPEVHAMLRARGNGFGDFGRILPVLDQLTSSGRELPDSVLLAALLLASVLVERFRAESDLGKPLSRAEVDALVHTTIAPFLERFAISHAKAQTVSRALTVFQRLCEPSWTRPRRRRLTRDKGFADALLLFEIMTQATGEGDEILHLWKQAAEQADDGPEEEPEAATRPKRRRRRRRRGGGGGVSP